MSTVKKNKASKGLQSGEMRSSKASLLEVMCITQRTRMVFKIIQGMGELLCSQLSHLSSRYADPGFT